MTNSSNTPINVHRCPAPHCALKLKSSHGLLAHWRARHQSEHGDLYRCMATYEPARTQGNGSDFADQLGSEHGPHEELWQTASQQAQAIERQVCGTAMDHIDQMKYRFFDSEATVSRAKQLAIDTLREIKPILLQTLAPHMKPGVNVEALVKPITEALDTINTRKREERFRKRLQDEEGPSLKVHKRVLGVRMHATSATTSRRAGRNGNGALDEAFVYETRLEEILEVELARDPELLDDILQSNEHWKAVNQSRSAERDSGRSFSDVCDGQVRDFSLNDWLRPSFVCKRDPCVPDV